MTTPFREQSRAWFRRQKGPSQCEKDATLIAEAAVKFGHKDAQALFAHIVSQKRLRVFEAHALKERALKLIAASKPTEKKPARKKPSKTFVQARQEILDALEQAGWTLSSRSLKVPHATSPSGKLRLWFKAQAVYFSRGSHHEMRQAHTVSYDLDIREMTGERFLEMILRTFPKEAA